MHLAKPSVNKTRILKNRGRSNPRKLIPSEFQEQVKFVQYLTIMKIKHYHIPNGGNRSLSEGVKFKRSGVKSGICDMCIPLARKPYHGLYIELKKISGGRITEEQKEWIEHLNAEGYCAKIAQGGDEAIEIVTWYLSLPKW